MRRNHNIYVAVARRCLHVRVMFEPKYKWYFQRSKEAARVVHSCTEAQVKELTKVK